MIAIIGIFVLIGALSGGGGSSAKPTRTMNVDVGWNAALIRIKNNGTSDAVGKTMTVYLNGTPPFAYKVEWPVPAVGDTALIPLTSFVDRDGNRFNPVVKAVTQAWVGGAGYDYAAYGK